MYSFKVAMTCSGCSSAVTRILTKAEGVDHFEVSLETQIVKVESATLSQTQIFDIIKKSGKATEVFI